MNCLIDNLGVEVELLIHLRLVVVNGGHLVKQIVQIVL
jgi:hypothetical protein